jgi:hypothetical protein
LVDAISQPAAPSTAITSWITGRQRAAAGLGAWLAGLARDTGILPRG